MQILCIPCLIKHLPCPVFQGHVRCKSDRRRCEIWRVLCRHARHNSRCDCAYWNLLGGWCQAQWRQQKNIDYSRTLLWLANKRKKDATTPHIIPWEDCLIAYMRQQKGAFKKGSIGNYISVTNSKKSCAPCFEEKSSLEICHINKYCEIKMHCVAHLFLFLSFGRMHTFRSC